MWSPVYTLSSCLFSTLIIFTSTHDLLKMLFLTQTSISCHTCNSFSSCARSCVSFLSFHLSLLPSFSLYLRPRRHTISVTLADMWVSDTGEGVREKRKRRTPTSRGREIRTDSTIMQYRVGRREKQKGRRNLRMSECVFARALMCERL